MQEGSRVLLKESFDRLKNRDTACVDSSDLIESHGLFAKSYKFKVPIHPKNLSQLIHPHWGYMASMPGKSYSWEEMLSMYEI